MQKEILLECLKYIRCNSRNKSGTEVATECIKKIEEKFNSTNTQSIVVCQIIVEDMLDCLISKNVLIRSQCDSVRNDLVGILLNKLTNDNQ